MAIRGELVMLPRELALGVDDDGNPCLVGVDRETGLSLTIVVSPHDWPAFKQAVGRLVGVGIAKAPDPGLVAGNGNGG